MGRNNMAFETSIDEKGEGGRLDALHNEINLLLTEAQLEHNVGKKRPFNSVECFGHI